MGYYKIIGNKLFFSDGRFDTNRSDIINIFKIVESIGGITSFNPHYPVKIELEKYNIFIQSIKDLEKKATDCRHKAEAVGYSLSLILGEISNKPTIQDFESFSEMIKNKMCPYIEIKNDVLLFEFESFLFQVSSNIDISIQMLKYVYPFLNNKNGFDSELFKSKKLNAGEYTIKKMNDNGEFTLANFYQKHVDNWYQDLHGLRNIITHRSSLEGFTGYIYNTDTGEILNPMLPNRGEIEEYCINCFKFLLSFYEELFNKFIIPKIEQQISELGG